MDDNYLSFYDEALSGNIIVEKYLPFKIYIVRMIRYYNNNSYINVRPFLDKIEFTKNLLSIFDRIINDDNYDNDFLDTTIDYVISVSLRESFIITFLELLLFKDRYLGEFEYFNKFENLFIFHDVLLQQNNNHPFCQLVDLYFKYLNTLASDLTKELKRRNFYKRMAPAVIIAFYLMNGDISILHKALYNISNNFEEFKDYLRLNIPYFPDNLESRILASKSILNDEIYQIKEIR